MEQYSILGRIGEGAHGIVFKAKHIEVTLLVNNTIIFIHSLKCLTINLYDTWQKKVNNYCDRGLIIPDGCTNSSKIRESFCFIFLYEKN